MKDNETELLVDSGFTDNESIKSLHLQQKNISNDKQLPYRPE